MRLLNKIPEIIPPSDGHIQTERHVTSYTVLKRTVHKPSNTNNLLRFIIFSITKAGSSSFDIYSENDSFHF
jgi:hypothetical protein